MVDWMIGWIDDDDNAGKTSLFVSLSSPPRHLTRYISELFSGRCFDADVSKETGQTCSSSATEPRFKSR